MTNAAQNQWIEEAENQTEQTTQINWVELGERQVLEEIWVPTWKHALADLGKSAWHCLFTPPRLVRAVAPNRRGQEEHQWKTHQHQRNWNS